MSFNLRATCFFSFYSYTSTYNFHFLGLALLAGFGVFLKLWELCETCSECKKAEPSLEITSSATSNPPSHQHGSRRSEGFNDVLGDHSQHFTSTATFTVNIPKDEPTGGGRDGQLAVQATASGTVEQLRTTQALKQFDGRASCHAHHPEIFNKVKETWLESCNSCERLREAEEGSADAYEGREAKVVCRTSAQVAAAREQDFSSPHSPQTTTFAKYSFIHETCRRGTRHRRSAVIFKGEPNKFDRPRQCGRNQSRWSSGRDTESSQLSTAGDVPDTDFERYTEITQKDSDNQHSYKAD